ncbi:adenylate kinase [Pseudoalteromonas sp. MSK9-3]|uniref:adenylate kinase n=1 Tax=Pseudoalteromonas sp. MSK9-3 TaxID=1897633 RepID=UPI000E6D22A3|nr:adenylate kinase [Pseudoalteromonas sp. MSK9-3]RJE75946.1 adenylate kinase [Pseudoalteromonas sp. MSK9-3]
MKKIAVFGKPGSGKSSLSNKLSIANDIELYSLDCISYKSNGEKVDKAVYDESHNLILSLDSWIIDGLGTLDSFYTRLDSADIWIFIDLPYLTSYWLVTKRLLQGLFVKKPLGWPEGSSILKGTLASYRHLKLSPQFWNENFEKEMNDKSAGKLVYVIRSYSELKKFTL